MKFGTFIIIDNDANMRFQAGKTYNYTQSGVIIYPIGKLLPIIRKGSDCIGLGKIISFTVTEETTRVTFTTMGKLSNEAKDAYYGLYRQDVTFSSHSSNDDIYDSTDTIIPGAMGLRGKKTESRNNKNSAAGFFNDIWD